MEKKPAETSAEEFRNVLVNAWRNMDMSEQSSWEEKKSMEERRHRYEWCKALQRVSPEVLSQYLMKSFKKEHKFSLSDFVTLTVTKQPKIETVVAESDAVQAEQEEEDDVPSCQMLFPHEAGAYLKPKAAMTSLLALEGVLSLVRARPSSKMTEISDTQKWVIFSPDGPVYCFDQQNSKKINKSYKKWDKSDLSQDASITLDLPCGITVEVKWAKTGDPPVHGLRVERRTLQRGMKDGVKAYAFPAA
jgi:hypothetical protein